MFFAFFFAFGIVFLVLLARDLSRQRAIGRWPVVPCTIRASGVISDGDEYRFKVSYFYLVNDQRRVGEKYRTDYKGATSYTDAQKLVDRYPAGGKTNCLVDPAHPDEAVLAAGNTWSWLLFMLLPILFILIGAGGIYETWRIGKPRALSDTTRPLSDQPTGVARQRAGAVVFGIFLLVGATITAIWVIPSLHRMVASGSWPATACKVISSRVQSHSSDDGTTYSIDVLYSYSVSGKEYRSNRYEFVGGSSSGYSGKKTVVDQYRPGTTAVCYVNPDDPHYAVLRRGFSWKALLFLIPVVFMLIGFGGLIGLHRSRRKKESSANIWALQRAHAPNRSPLRAGPIIGSSAAPLRPAQSARAKFLGLLIFTLIWDGGLAAFFTVWSSGGFRFELCSTLFAIPFVAVGVGLIVGVIHTGLSLANPTTELSLLPAIVPLGASAQLRWQMQGRTDRISKLTIRIEGREEAHYRRGTSNYIDRNVFLILPVVETTSSIEIARGVIKIEIPRDTMHSFAAPNNKIIWEIKLRGAIARWPDLSADYPLEIAPLETPGPEVSA